MSPELYNNAEFQVLEPHDLEVGKTYWAVNREDFDGKFTGKPVTIVHGKYPIQQVKGGPTSWTFWVMMDGDYTSLTSDDFKGFTTPDNSSFMLFHLEEAEALSLALQAETEADQQERERNRIAAQRELAQAFKDMGVTLKVGGVYEISDGKARAVIKVTSPDGFAKYKGYRGFREHARLSSYQGSLTGTVKGLISGRIHYVAEVD